MEGTGVRDHNPNSSIATIPVMSLWLHLALLAVLGWGALAETGCPPPEDVEPCLCTDFPSTRLTCHDLSNLEVLEGVFKNSERYFFHEVWIRSSSLMYIPQKIFERTQVGELFVVDTSMVALFDSSPNSESLYKIQLDGVSFQRNSLFGYDLLKNFTNLRVLVINNSFMTRIPSDMGRSFPSSLRQITFNNTAIRRIYPGAFDGLENLDKFAVTFSKLNNLTRNRFPRPFNVRFLYFDHNNIDSIPEDLFTEMPNLQFLTLRNNSLSAVPEAAFTGRSTNVPYLRLEGNPLNCNCLMLWLIKDKPEVIDGTCSSPPRLRGKRLQDLAPADFNC